MAIAGKVAITPGGEWSVDVAYDKLVVVTFGNNVYLSIKPSTGIEPTNEEYWMLLIENVTQEQYENIINGTTTVGNANNLGGKSASEYALLGSNTLTGFLGLQNNQESLIGFSAKNALREVRLYVSNTGKIQLYDATSGKAILASEADGTNTFNGTASGNLPLSGGTLSGGDLYMKGGYGYLSADGNGMQLQSLTNQKDTTNRRSLWIKNNRYESNIADALTLLDTNNGSNTHYKVLHTGNKPTGTYTGNGSATSRTISTGTTVGNAVLIYSSAGFALLTPYGAITKDNSSTSVNGISWNDCAFSPSSGSIVLTTTSYFLNQDGTTYTYRVL